MSLFRVIALALALTVAAPAVAEAKPRPAKCKKGHVKKKGKCKKRPVAKLPRPDTTIGTTAPAEGETLLPPGPTEPAAPDFATDPKGYLRWLLAGKHLDGAKQITQFDYQTSSYQTYDQKADFDFCDDGRFQRDPDGTDLYVQRGTFEVTHATFTAADTGEGYLTLSYPGTPVTTTIAITRTPEALLVDGFRTTTGASPPC